MWNISRSGRKAGSALRSAIRLNQDCREGIAIEYASPIVFYQYLTVLLAVLFAKTMRKCLILFGEAAC